MSADWAYLDSSAFVKLANPEQESEALRRFLQRWPQNISSALLMVEALRAMSHSRPDFITATRQRLRDVRLVAVDDSVLEHAASIGPPRLRSLDAIHLATARLMGDDLGVLVTYDRRLAQAATELGMPVVAPS